MYILITVIIVRNITTRHNKFWMSSKSTATCIHIHIYIEVYIHIIYKYFFNFSKVE